jgi:type IV pilus assembly protein PilC
MALFTYVARDSAGNIVRGEEDVDTPETLVRALQRKQLYVVRVQQKRAGFSANAEIELPKWLGGDRTSAKERTVFTRQLGTLMRAGVSIVGSMAALQSQAKTGAMRRLIRDVREYIETGMPVADAFAEREEHFGELYINLVRAGDATGTLPETMQSLADHLERAGKIAAKIKSALTYPMTVLLIALAIAYYLLTQIVPAFAEILRDLEAELPKITEITLGISDFLQKHPLETLGGILAIVGFFYTSYRTERGKYIYHVIFARLPIVKLIFLGSSVASFCSALAVSLRSGLPIVDSLEVAQRVVGNRVMRTALDRVIADVSRGEPLSRSLATFPATFPSVLVSMINSGEDSGNVEAMVENSRDYFQTEVDNTVGNLTTLIEPVMIVLLGGLVAVIMLSLFLPLWGALSAMNT